MRVAVEPEPLAGFAPKVARSVPHVHVWRRRAILVAGHVALAVFLVPALLLLGLVVVGCAVAVLAPFVALPVLHAPFPWPALLTEGLAALGVQAPRLVPALFAGLIWLGLSSAATLLLIGARWTG